MKDYKENQEYYENLDKRTKDYKSYKAWKEEFDLKQSKDSKGLGDTVEKIAKVTGVKSVVNALFGDDCGCDERKDKLNQLFRYNVVNCLEEDEYNYLNEFLSKSPNRVSMSEQRRLLSIFNRVFNQRRQMTSCSSCVKSIVKELEKLIKNY